jgi:Phage tail protein.
MISQVVVTNAAGSVLTFDLYDVNNGYALEKVEGLDPVKATIVSSSYASLDGGAFQNAKNDPRNIKLTIGLEPNYTDQTVQSLRQGLYAFLMPKSKVSLQFYDDLTGLNSADIVGYVESFEGPLFTDVPEVNVSILCFDPDFVAHDETVFSSNSSADGTTYVTLTYDGTVDSGFVFKLDVNRTLAELTIKRLAPDGTYKIMTFAFSTNLVSGDDLYVSTIPGNKYVEKEVAGVRTPILYSLSRQSEWITLEPGANQINVDTAAGASIPYTITYNDRFGGL